MKTMNETILQKLTRLVPRDVQGYVRSRGWQKVKPIDNLMLYNRTETGSLDQVLVPMNSSRPDFPERMRDAVEKLASFEARPVSTIVTDLLNFDADVLRYRVASRRAQRGTLPLVQAIDLLTGAKQTILSAAHSVLIPTKYHPKLSRSEARQFLDACQMNQTEQNSFVVAISCPMKALDAEEAGLYSNHIPFARRATTLLTQALSSLDRAIEEDRVNSVVDQENPIVSANLCDALLKMRPSQDDGILEFLPSWASSMPIGAEDKLSSVSITFSGDEFESIEEVYRQLRPKEDSQPKAWIAFVDELKGSECNSGMREGEVVFTIFDDDEVIRTKASLTKEQYQIAYNLHNPARPILVDGQLHRGPRVSRLTQITELRPALPTDAADR